MLLTICIPTFNRREELNQLFESVLASNIDIEKIEIVICDDGSTDNTFEVVKKYDSIVNIKYFYQSNSGRALALKKAIENASGLYTIIMDSDDIFLNDWFEKVKYWIIKIETDSFFINNNVKSLIFGCILEKNNKQVVNLPPKGLTNFIALRADLKVKYDLKEIVLTDVLKKNLYNIDQKIRRVPTSLLWAKVAQEINTYAISEPLVKKIYLPDGMTKKNLELRVRNPEPLLELYELLVLCKRYKSSVYRLRSLILWGRYANHANKVYLSNLWKLTGYILGFPIFLIDKFILLTKKYFG